MRTYSAEQPNDDMCEKLAESDGGRVQIMSTPAEEAGIEAGTIDRVTAAQGRP